MWPPFTIATQTEYDGIARVMTTTNTGKQLEITLENAVCTVIPGQPCVTGDISEEETVGDQGNLLAVYSVIL